MPASWGLRNAFVFVDTPGPHDPAQDSIGGTREKSHSPRLLGMVEAVLGALEIDIPTWCPPRTGWQDAALGRVRLRPRVAESRYS